MPTKPPRVPPAAHAALTRLLRGRETYSDLILRLTHPKK